MAIEPGLGFVQLATLQMADPFPTALFTSNERGIFKNAEMFGGGCETDFERLGQRANGFWPRTQAFEHGAPRWVAQRPESLIQSICIFIHKVEYTDLKDLFN